MEGPTHLGWYRYRNGFMSQVVMAFLVKKSVFEGILDRLEAALLPWARGRSTRGVVRGHMPGGRGSPRPGPVPVPVRVKKISFVSKKAGKYLFLWYFGLFGGSSPALGSYKVHPRCGPRPCTWETRLPPLWTGTGTGTCQKNIFCVEKRRENIFCVEKMCQDVQPMFRRRISR